MKNVCEYLQMMDENGSYIEMWEEYENGEIEYNEVIETCERVLKEWKEEAEGRTLKNIEKRLQIVEIVKEAKKIVENNENEKHSFDHEGINIVNPFYDESLRFSVCPIEYYGIENIERYVKGE